MMCLLENTDSSNWYCNTLDIPGLNILIGRRKWNFTVVNPISLTNNDNKILLHLCVSVYHNLPVRTKYRELENYDALCAIFIDLTETQAGRYTYTIYGKQKNIH